MASGEELTTYQFGKEAKIYERLIFDHRGFLLLLFTIMTILFGIQASKLKVDASFEKMIPMEHPYVKAMFEHIDDIGAGGTQIQIAVETTEGDIFDPDYMETLRKVSDEVFYLEGADRRSLKSLWTPNVRWSEVTEQGFEGDAVIPSNYDGSPETIEALRRNVLRSGQVGRLVGDNFKSTIVQVNLFDTHPETGEPLDYSRFSTDLEEKIRNQYQSDKIKIHIIGVAKIFGDLIEGGMSIVLFAIITFFITAILLFGYSRCFKSTLAPLFCSVMAVVWQLGLLHTLGFALNAYSMLVPFLVFAIGVSHGVQMINAISIEVANGSDSYLAARRAFRVLYIAGMTALVSDAIGFITLYIIEIEVIKILAVAACVGVAVIILTNLVLLPIIMSYIGVSCSGRIHTQKRNKADPKFWKLLAKCANPKVARVSIVIALLGFVGGYIGGLDLKIGDLDEGAPELRPDSRYNLDNKYIVDNYATSSDILMVLVETEPEACSKYENMEKIDRFGWEMENIPGVETAISLTMVTKQVLMGFSEGNLKWNGLSRDQRAIDSTFFAIPQPLVNIDCSFAPVMLFLKDHKAETLEGAVEAIEAFAAKNNTDQIKFLLGSGNAGIEAATNQEIDKSQLRMLLLVYGVVCVLVFISFGSITTVICIIIPLALTSILCQALMAYLGIGVKVATLPVIALGVGVGVDYGIYIYGRLETFLKEGQNLQEAYLNTLTSTGRAVGLTGIALAIGVGTWIFSPIKFQADMGMLLTFMFLLNMVGAIWLLPALAHFLIKPERIIARAQKKDSVKRKQKTLPAS